MGDRLPDLHVEVEHDGADVIFDQSGGQGAAILPAARLVEDAAAQPCLDDMQFGLAHGALDAEQQAVVEAGRIVDAVFIEDQGIGKSNSIICCPAPGRVT